MQFVVLAVHHVEAHGRSAAVMLTTEDLANAVEVAKAPESYGYDFHHNDPGAGVALLRLETGVACHRQEMFFPEDGSLPLDHPVLLRRWKEDGQWRERCYDPEFMDRMSQPTGKHHSTH